MIDWEKVTLSTFISGFKDELVATALILVLTAVGGFYAVNRLAGGGEQEEAEATQVLGTSEAGGNEQVVNQVETPTATPTTTIEAYNPEEYEQPYGNDQEFDYDEYRLTFSNPRLMVGKSRIFKVDVVLANKNVSKGLKNKFMGTIVREGEVVTEAAPLTISEIKTVFPGEKITFGAKLTLIGGTDLTRITFDPQEENVQAVIYDL